MRLSTNDIHSILEVISSFDKDANVFLHGSRLQDEQVGGDIDLFVLLPQKNVSKFELQKHYVLAKLKMKIGDQKIDITVVENEGRDKNDFFRESEKIELKL